MMTNFRAAHENEALRIVGNMQEAVAGKLNAYADKMLAEVRQEWFQINPIPMLILDDTKVTPVFSIDSGPTILDTRSLVRISEPQKERLVTESEWLSSTDPQAMLSCLSDDTDDSRRRFFVSERKLWLFVLEVEKHWWGKHIDTRSCQIVEAIAEGKLPSSDVSKVSFSYSITDSPALTATTSMHIHNLEKDKPVWAHLLRDIFGNPFRPIVLDIMVVRKEWFTWREGTIPALAKAIYDERRFEDLPILADALEEAGCQEQDILMHCRGREKCFAHPTSELSKYQGEWVVGKHGMRGPKGPITCDRCGVIGNPPGLVPLRGPHVRGCWVLDLLLGKS